MFGSMFEVAKIDSRVVKLILIGLVGFASKIDSNLKLGFVAFEFKHDFYA